MEYCRAIVKDSCYHLIAPTYIFGLETSAQSLSAKARPNSSAQKVAAKREGLGMIAGARAVIVVASSPFLTDKQRQEHAWHSFECQFVLSTTQFFLARLESIATAFGGRPPKPECILSRLANRAGGYRRVITQPIPGA